MTTLLLGVVLQGGCGSGVSMPSTVPVKGVVKIKGKPARGIRVKFHSQDSSQQSGFIPTGDTGPDGGFTLSTGAPQNGAPPGSYMVTFERPIIDPKNPVETEVDGLKGKYSDPAQSKWTVTIENGENSLQPFELE
jgi:hypothetical protein